MATFKAPTLGPDGRVREKHLPAGLADAALKNAYAPVLAARAITDNAHLPIRGAGPENLSDGIITTRTTQFFHTVRVAADGIRFAFSNYYNNAGVSTVGPNDITVKATIRMTGGLSFPVYFSGRRSAVVEPGGVLLSDPIGLSLAKGDTFYSRTLVTVTSGQKFPLGRLTNTATSEGVANSDQLEGSLSVNALRGYGPSLIIGKPAVRTTSPQLLFIGDSNAAGYNDVTGSADAYGVLPRAFDGKFTYTNTGLSSSSVGNSDSLSELLHRMAVADVLKYDAAVVLQGTNDVQGAPTLATMQLRYQNLWTILQKRGLPIYQCTIPPYTTSTDAWATTANQTVTANEALRVSVNDWLRTTPSPVTHVYDIADAAESARNSGKWKAGYTLDGVHFGATGAAAAAAAIDTSLIGAVLP